MAEDRANILPTRVRAKALLVLGCAAALSCAPAATPPRPTADEAPDRSEIPDRVERDVSAHEPSVLGHIVAQTPFWLGIESGDEGKLHVDASDEQFRELQAKYEKLLFYACERGPEHGYQGMAWEIRAKPVARSLSFRLPPMNGESVKWWDLYPIRVDGVRADGSSDILLELPVRQGPVWEDLLSDPLHVRFSRYLEYVTRDSAWRGIPEDDRRAVVKIWVEPEQAGLKKRFEWIEVKISAVDKPLRFPVSEAVGLTANVRGERILGDEKVVLEYVDGITTDGKRTSLYAW